MLLVTYRRLLEIESESVFEVEKTDETIKDLNHRAARIQEIEAELRVLDEDINLTGQKEEIVYTEGKDIPAMKAELERQERLRDILVQDRASLIETSKRQKQELEERRAGLVAIANAQEQILLAMNETRKEQLNEYEKLVIRLLGHAVSRPTGILQVDDFLLALREYRQFQEANLKPRPLTIGDISRLASYARACLERNESINH
jgi:hypothetical protein